MQCHQKFYMSTFTLRTLPERGVLVCGFGPLWITVQSSGIHQTTSQGPMLFTQKESLTKLTYLYSNLDLCQVHPSELKMYLQNSKYNLLRGRPWPSMDLLTVNHLKPSSCSRANNISQKLSLFLRGCSWPSMDLLTVNQFTPSSYPQANTYQKLYLFLRGCS